MFLADFGALRVELALNCNSWSIRLDNAICRHAVGFNSDQVDSSIRAMRFSAARPVAPKVNLCELPAHLAVVFEIRTGRLFEPASLTSLGVADFFVAL